MLRAFSLLLGASFLTGELSPKPSLHSLKIYDFFAFSDEIRSYTNLDCSGVFHYAPEQTNIPICMPIVRAYATLCSTVYGACPFEIGSISACSIVKTSYSCLYIICGRTLQIRQ